jgi:L-asparaginase II
MTGRVVLEREGRRESTHRVHLAVVDAAGGLQTRNGDPDLAIFVRSAAKPFQALPLVQDGAGDRWGITARELAACCGSHGGEAGHLACVRGLLDRIGVPESSLACGPHDPMNEDAARALLEAGQVPRPIHNNCSGKHAGMLALARYHGWPTRGYRLRDHPVQRRMRAEMTRWAGVPEGEMGLGIDGCGVVCFHLPLRAMARAYARLVEAAEEGEPASAAVVGAMAQHPFQVAGTDRLCTVLIEATRGRVIAKVGAEGVYGAGERRRRFGLALKVEDGARRAAEVALVTAMVELGWVEGEEREALGPWVERTVPNTLGEPAAVLRAEGRMTHGGEG